MKLRLATLALLAGVFVVAGGCPQGTSTEQNPFLTLAETFGLGSRTTTSSTTTTGNGATTTVAQQFRQKSTFTFKNNHPAASVDFSWVAWVNVGSIRSADQQDALFAGGFIQLGHEERLGTAFVLPVGTFIYNGPGLAGATPVRLGKAGATGAEPDTQTVLETDGGLLTPDVFLVFSQPPVSCDSAAFVFLNPQQSGNVGPETSGGGFKTFAQVDAYQCEPLRPGLFLKIGGGSLKMNEFLEGYTVRFDFNQNPDAQGHYALVTIAPPP